MAKKGHIPWNIGKHMSEKYMENYIKGRIKMWQNPEYREKQIKAQTGRKCSQKTKEKMSEGRIGSHRSEKTKQKMSKAQSKENHPFWGKHRTKETKRKISESTSGEKNWNWQGGKSFEPYDAKFNEKLKRQIKERDDWTCQLCGFVDYKKDGKLTVHHADYNKKNSIPESLITLCIKCNSKVNFNREYWRNYFNGTRKAKNLHKK